MDKDFNNGLDLAIDNGHMDIAQLILRDDEWKDALCNDNRWKDDVDDNEYNTPMRKVSTRLRLIKSIDHWVMRVRASAGERECNCQPEYTVYEMDEWRSVKWLCGNERLEVA